MHPTHMSITSVPGYGSAKGLCFDNLFRHPTGPEYFCNRFPHVTQRYLMLALYFGVVMCSEG